MWQAVEYGGCVCGGLEGAKAQRRGGGRRGKEGGGRRDGGRGDKYEKSTVLTSTMSKIK